jgi:Zn finger protein HypA/HybF involved in hydrogenase expression
MSINYGQVLFDDGIADDYGKELLKNGIIEAKAGNKDSARRYFDRATYMSSDHEVMAEAWFWMSQVTDDPVEKRKALENCLSNDLQHARARRALAILDGKIKSDEIVDPDALPAAPAHLSQADAQRFMCPKCGGRMTFAPDGQSLVCEYCARNQSLHTQAPAKQEDFIVAMATARGHDKPLAEQVFQCQGCGAQFILPPDQLSAVCVYCGSPHVVNLEKSKDLIAPDGIIPFAFDQKHAIQLLINWVEGNQIKPEKQVEQPRGLYLPLWTFDLGGVIDYTGEMVDESDIGFGRRQPKMIQVNDSYPLLIHDCPIPASRKLSAPFVRLIPTFDLKAIQPYDPRYLADWPAELYDIPMADASLDARGQAVSIVKRDLPSKAGLAKLISTSSANMTIDSFRLNLLPVWMTEIWLENRSHLVLISGQNDTVQSDIATKSDKAGVVEWLGDLLKD